MTKTFRVTMRYPDGQTMFMGTVMAEEISDPPQPSGRQTSPNNNTAASDGERMTDPQKRYLFRLLAAQGVDNKKAEQHLKEYFRATRLADIPKALASAYIDQLVKDQNDAKGT